MSFAFEIKYLLMDAIWCDRNLVSLILLAFFRFLFESIILPMFIKGAVCTRLLQRFIGIGFWWRHRLVFFFSLVLFIFMNILIMHELNCKKWDARQLKLYIYVIVLVFASVSSLSFVSFFLFSPDFMCNLVHMSLTLMGNSNKREKRNIGHIWFHWCQCADCSMRSLEICGLKMLLNLKYDRFFFFRFVISFAIALEQIKNGTHFAHIVFTHKVTRCVCVSLFQSR